VPEFSLAAEHLVTAETDDPPSSPHFSFLLLLLSATLSSLFPRSARLQPQQPTEFSSA